MGGKRRLFVIAQHDLQLAGDQRRADLVIQDAGDTPTLTGCGDCRLVGVALEGRRDRRFLIAGETPFRRSPGTGRRGDAVIPQIGRGGGNNKKSSNFERNIAASLEPSRPIVPVFVV
ncbi:hypothetical protein D9M72_497170 [compost metagenome]